MGCSWVGASLAFVVAVGCVVVSCGSDHSSTGDGGIGDAGADVGPGDAGCAAPHVRCGEQCVDTATDTNNCGICGHTCGCGSTSCTAGMCDPAVLADKQGGPYVLTLSNGQL